MRPTVIFLAVLLAAGCAIPKAREFRAWDRTAHEAASTGAVLWSAYYAQRFERLQSAPPLIAARGTQMQQALTLRDIALEVEAGKRPSADLTRAQQKAQADLQAVLDQEDAAMSAAAASRPIPKTTTCRPIGASVICN